MPTINKIFTLDVSVDQFLIACSDIELQEIVFRLDAELHRRKAIKKYEVTCFNDAFLIEEEIKEKSFNRKKD